MNTAASLSTRRTVAEDRPMDSIRQGIVDIPGWVISSELRSKASQGLDEFQVGC